MAQNLQADVKLTGSGSITDDVTDVIQRFGFGGAILPNVQITFTHGTGANQVNKNYLKKHSVANGATNLHDLKALTDFQGAALDFAKIKYIGVFIISPDGTKLLRVGPQAAANPFVGFWGDASDYEKVYHSQDWMEPVAGLATSGTNKVLAIHNPSTLTDYALWVMGTDV